MSRRQKLHQSLPMLGRVFGRLSPYVRRERPLLAGSFAALFAATILQLLEPWPLKFVFDRIIVSDVPAGETQSSIDSLDSMTLLTLAAVAMVVITALRALAEYFNRVGLALAGNRVLTQVRNDLYCHVQSLSLAFHSRARSGDLVVRLIGDVTQIRECVVTALLPMLANVLILVGMVAVMFVLEWRLALVAMAVIPLFGLTTIRLSSRIHQVARKQRQRQGALAAAAAESMGAMKVIQTLSLEDSFSRHFSSESKRDLKESVKGSRLAPRLARYGQTLAQKVANRLAEQRPQRHAIHGDFYPKQIVLAEHHVGVLDLDEATCGDPATDLGNFRAHLCDSVIRGELSEQTAESAAEALFEGYCGARHPNTMRRVDLYAAANLLRLTPHPFRDRDPDWQSQIEAMLDRVERMLRGGLASAGSTPQRCQTKVNDPFDLLSRPEVSFLSDALDPSSVTERLSPIVRGLPGVVDPLHLAEIRVVRHKAGRRCLIEYEFITGPAAAETIVTLVGKVRLKGVDRSTWSWMNQLWDSGLDGASDDGISLPRPVAMIPEWRMWLQQKVAGTAATDLLAGDGGVELSRRIAEAIHKLHRLGPPATRRHTSADELRILSQKVPLAADLNPGLSERIQQILIACEQLANDLPPAQPTPIHRDFYPDHILVDGNRIHLLDLDLYCQGDPGLDVGNFCAHIQEQSLRQHGRADALADREEALQERFIELTGEHVRSSVDAYLSLSLTRHIYLSGLFPDRRPLTARLVELCEARLGLTGPSTASATSTPTAAHQAKS